LPGTKVVSSYNNLSLIYKGDLGDRRQRGFGLGRLEKALEFQLKALNIREQVLDKNHPDLAQSYNNIAMIYKAVKDYEPAETYGEKAVAILQRLFPNGHPNLETAKRNLEGRNMETVPFGRYFFRLFRRRRFKNARRAQLPLTMVVIWCQARIP